MESLKEILETAKVHFKTELNEEEKQLSRNDWKGSLENLFYHKVNIDVTKVAQVADGILNKDPVSLKLLSKVKPEYVVFTPDDFLAGAIFDTKYGIKFTFVSNNKERGYTMLIPDETKDTNETEDISKNEKNFLEMLTLCIDNNTGKRSIKLQGYIPERYFVENPSIDFLRKELKGFGGVLYFELAGMPKLPYTRASWEYPVIVKDFADFDRSKILPPSKKAINALLTNAVGGLILERLNEPARQAAREMLMDEKLDSYTGVEIYKKRTEEVLLKFDKKWYRKKNLGIFNVPDPIYDSESIDTLKIFFK